MAEKYPSVLWVACPSLQELYLWIYIMFRTPLIVISVGVAVPRRATLLCGLCILPRLQQQRKGTR
jgi:hypothetical protein